MQTTQLGRAGLTVSRLCLGTMNFGRETLEPEAFAIMDRALDRGVNFFDTADVYGGKLGEGITEQIVGRWLGQGGGRRERIVLATKVYGRMGEGPNERRLSAYHVRHACEESLRRLRTDHIDLYQMHHVDRLTPWEEIWQAFETLIRAGKVLYVGTSNFAAWQIAQGQSEARARGLVGLVSEQSLYNLTARTVELEVLPACRALGVAVLPWSPLAGGLLAGGSAAAAAGQRRAGAAIQARAAAMAAQLAKYGELCAELGAEPADVALAWLLRDPVVTAPIVGPRTVAQLEGSFRALEIELDAEALARLDMIWPGPGGEAPEAYAW